MKRSPRGDSEIGSDRECVFKGSSDGITKSQIWTQKKLGCLPIKDIYLPWCKYHKIYLNKNRFYQMNNYTFSD